VTPQRLDRAEAWFERYGDAAVFGARMLPVVRSFISIPAGIAEMPLRRYTPLSFLGTVPWCFGLAAAGLALGTGWERFHEGWRYADYAIMIILALGVVYLVVRVLRRRSRRGVRPERAG
jgi:membrane protein DedA with SNARE-associated domain